MALNAKTAEGSGGSNRPDPLEPGAYPTRLVQLVDCGLQAQRPYQGQEKPPCREIMFTYEFLDEFLKDEDGQEMPDKPRWLSEFVPLHNLNSEKAKSTLRYKALDPTLEHDGDFAALVGTPVNVMVVQNPGKGQHAGKIFENISGTTAMRDKDKAKAPELVNEPVVFDLDDPDIAVFLNLPKFVQDKVKANLEFSGSTLEKLVDAAGSQSAATDNGTDGDNGPAEEPAPEDTDDNPY